MTYSGFHQSEAAEIDRFLLFLDLIEDSALLNSDAVLQTFYANNQSNAIGTLIQIGQLLSEGQLSAANTAIVGFSENTSIEANYKQFYTLYIKFMDPAQGLDLNDKALLATLAQKRPFIDGAVIYNARALNTLVNSTIVIYNDDDCDSQESSLMYNEDGGGLGSQAHKSEASNDLSKNTDSYNYYLFPNPATDQLTIVSAIEKEEIQIEIKDLNNKLILKTRLIFNNYQANVKLDLINGAYFVTLINSKHERIVNKLVVSK